MTLEEKLGQLAKNLQPVNTREFDVEYTLYETTFLQKFIPAEMLEKGIRINPAEYFKGLIAVNYFCEVLDGNYDACDNLVKISKRLRSIEKEKKADKGLSYLPLGITMLEIGLFASEKNSCQQSDEARKRYERIQNAGNDRKPDNYYTAIGEMLCEMVAEERKPMLEHVQSRAELSALIFCDSAISLLKTPDAVKKINEQLAKKEYFSASVTALASLKYDSSLDFFKEQIKGVLKNAGI